MSGTDGQARRAWRRSLGWDCRSWPAASGTPLTAGRARSRQSGADDPQMGTAGTARPNVATCCAVAIACHEQPSVLGERGAGVQEMADMAARSKPSDPPTRQGAGGDLPTRRAGTTSALALPTASTGAYATSITLAQISPSP